VNLYSAYEYLSFILPGGVVLFASFYGYHGWPWSEPGGTALVGILAACFLVGHANAALAQYFQPLLWGSRPSNRANSEWGMFGPAGAFPQPGDRDRLESEMAATYPGLSFQQAFATAVADMRRTGDDEFLKVLNSQIGLYRNLTTASLLSAAIVLYYNLSSHQHLPLLPWLPIFAGATVLFANRYRNFWKRYGAAVVSAMRSSSPDNPLTTRSEGSSDHAKHHQI
jgi:hypothetical protein